VNAGWLDRHTAKAPPALRARVHKYLSGFGSDPSPAQVAAAADAALTEVLSQRGDRAAALDLLAADALITLALLAQAQTAPERLEEFAVSVLRTGRSEA
jgi:hypothetical protein